MNVYTCTDHDCVCPTGVASIVVAESEEQARALLQAELDSRHLGDVPFTLQLVDITVPSATVLQDGDY